MARIVTSIVAAISLTLAAPVSAGWFDSKPKDKVSAEETKSTLDNQMQAWRSTGMPGISNWTERRMVKYLYELRDKPNYQTYTYYVDMNGVLHKLCDSVGYGINASIQYSNPMRVKEVEHYGEPDPVVTVPQPEPNGLYMPEGLAATYAMCLDGDEIRPVYVEPELIVSPFPLK